MTNALKIPPYIHRCIVPSGSTAVFIPSHEVVASDVEYGWACEVCGAPLASHNDLLLHMYDALVETAADAEAREEAEAAAEEAALDAAEENY